MTATLERPLSPARPEGKTAAPQERAHWLVTAAAGTAVMASATSLNGVIESWTWFLPVLRTVIPVLLVMALSRAVRLPEAVTALAGLLALGGALTAQFLSARSILGVIPGPGSSVQVRILLNRAEETITSQVAPVLPGAGIFLVTCAAIGLIAVAVDLLATTLRMPALTGVPLLCLMVVPAIVKPTGVGIGPFLLTAAAYLLLLGCAQWREGLVFSEAGSGSSGYLSRGLAIGAATLTVVLLLPLAIPGFTTGAFPQGSRLKMWGTSTGLNPAVTLGNDLRNPTGFGQITYATDSPDPVYLRAVTLEDFSGQRWEPDQRLAERERGLQDMGSESFRAANEFGESSLTRIDTQSYTSPWLLAPYAPASVTNLNGRWTWDPKNLSILSYDGGTTVRQTYDVRSSSPEVTRERLSTIRLARRGVVDPIFTELPEDTPEIVKERTQEVAGRFRNPYDKALAIQNYLRGPDFTYSVDAPVEGGYDGSSMDVMARFLDVKSGYCVHYAGTMAVMARAAGIPSRVAVGYTPGLATGEVYDGPDDTELREFEVDSRNAHAWPELYFRGVGWVRFEPTPSRGVVPEYARAAVSPAGAPIDDENLNPGRVPGVPGAAASPGAESPQGSRGGAGSAEESAGAAGAAVLAAAALALLPLLLRTARTASRRRRVLEGPEAGAATAAWEQTADVASDYGHPMRPTDTPRSFSVRLASEAGFDGAAAGSLERLQRAYEREEYAAPRPNPRPLPAAPGGGGGSTVLAPDKTPDQQTPDRTTGTGAWSDVEAVTASLRRGSTPKGRLIARFLPRSLAGGLLRGGGPRRPERS